MTIINLPIATPRDAAMIKSTFPLNEGLLGNYFFGYFTLAGLLFFLILIFVLPSKGAGLKAFQLVFVPLMFGGASYYFLHKANKIYTQRLDALTNGIPISAIVTAQGNAFNPLKSSKDYTLSLRFKDGTGANQTTTISSTNASLYQYTVGTTINGLYSSNNDASYFPVLYGYDIIFQ